MDDGAPAQLVALTARDSAYKSSLATQFDVTLECMNRVDLGISFRRWGYEITDQAHAALEMLAASPALMKPIDVGFVEIEPPAHTSVERSLRSAGELARELKMVRTIPSHYMIPLLCSGLSKLLHGTEGRLAFVHQPYQQDGKGYLLSVYRKIPSASEFSWDGKPLIGLETIEITAQRTFESIRWVFLNEESKVSYFRPRKK